MKLFHGVIFGTGLGLITAGIGGIANDYTILLSTCGVLLMLTEARRAFLKR